MSLLWFILGIAIIVLLALNIILLKRNRMELKAHEFKSVLDKDALFLENCCAYHLSPREIEVLRLILMGHTYRSAGGSLFISEKTVDSHMQSVFRKVGERNKMALYNKLHAS